MSHNLRGGLPDLLFGVPSLDSRIPRRLNNQDSEFLDCRYHQAVFHFNPLDSDVLLYPLAAKQAIWKSLTQFFLQCVSFVTCKVLLYHTVIEPAGPGGLAHVDDGTLIRKCIYTIYSRRRSII